MFSSEYMNTPPAPPILDRLSALGDETRTRILALLERSELTVSELRSVLGIPQPSVSRHLKVLSEEGWLQVRAEGRRRHYRLAADFDGAAREVWSIVRRELEGTGIYSDDRERARAVLTDRQRRSVRFFAEAAEHWDDLRADLFGSAALLAPLLGLLDPDWTVGDLGAGTGTLTEIVAPFVRKVIAVDRSDEMLSAARLRLGNTANVEIRRGSLEMLPLGDGEVDVAVLSLVLHYVVEPGAVLAEAHRVLRPGGRLILLDTRSHERSAGYAEEMGHVWTGFETDAIDAWLDDAGFTAGRLRPLPPDPSASGPLLFLATATRP
jgi:SAM-dependent methyltransferase/predicted transcriptional regulator